jgi:hypothetical protein
MLSRYIAYEFHYYNSFADASAAEKADLAALGIGAEQVYRLNARFKHFRRRRLFGKGWGLAVDRPFFLYLWRGFAVYRLAHDVEHAPKGRVPYGNGNGPARVHAGHPARKAVCGFHGDTTHHTAAEVLGNLKNDRAVFEADLQGVVQVWHCAAGKLNVKHRADDLYDTPYIHAFVNSSILQLFPTPFALT